MQPTRTLVCLCLCLLLSGGLFSPLLAQTEPILNMPVMATQATKLGTTPPLLELAIVPATDQSKLQAGKTNGKPVTVPNFYGRGQGATVQNPNALPQGIDPVVQTNANKSGELIVEPIVDINGMDALISNSTPPDPTGTIGKDHYVQMINSTYLRIYNKDGSTASDAIPVNTIWASVGIDGGGDPIILYDQQEDRWLLTEFSPPGPDQLLIAVSETSDPGGAWTAYMFVAPNFPDYPKYAIWPNAYMVTTNEFGAQLPFYVIDRQAMLAGEEEVAIQRLGVPRIFGGPGFQVATPVDWDGNTPPPANTLPMIMRMNDDAWGNSANDRLDIYEVDIDFENPNNTQVLGPQELPVSAYDSYPCATSGPGFACIPQPNGQGIDGLPEVLMHRIQYRNWGNYETMVLNFITDAYGNNTAGIRWIELRRNPGSEWEVYQEGTFAPDDGLHRFMGSIAMDGAGNIGLAYSISGTTKQPSLRFTGRRASDPLGEMTIEEYEFGVGNGNATFGRYGDYAHMSVDPVDDRTFWYTGEFMKFATSWGTRIVAFQVARDTVDMAPVDLTTPQDAPLLGTDETISILVRNMGVDTLNAFVDVGYQINGAAPVIETINLVNLATDEEYEHSFIQTADLSQIGEYEITIFTSLPNDANALNDTLRFVRNHLPRYDAGISGVNGLTNQVCGDTLLVELELTNFGTEVLENVTIDWSLNGNPPNSILWSGALANGASELYLLELIGLQDGTNTLTATTSLPNGELDEVPTNDQLERDFQTELNGVSIFFTLETDSHPHETTWELTDENGNVLYSGGPYAQLNGFITEEWCLDPEACYDFTIFDLNNDGFAQGSGSYSIVTEYGVTAASLIQENFGSSETNDFCATPACMVMADVNLTPVSGSGESDGAILVSPTTGVAPYQFSIDDGANFQTDNGLFTDLSPGNYEILVIDANECEFELNVTIIVCLMQAVPAVSDPSAPGAADGSIVVTVINGFPPVQFSIDGGTTFQGSPAFNDLAEGLYDILVIDANGCSRLLENIAVGDPVSTGEEREQYLLEVFPNPTAGVFRINLTGLSGTQHLPLEIYDAAGRLVLRDQLNHYTDFLTAQVSLQAFPAGTYYVRVRDPRVQELLRIVKQ